MAKGQRRSRRAAKKSGSRGQPGRGCYPSPIVEVAGKGKAVVTLARPGSKTQAGAKVTGEVHQAIVEKLPTHLVVYGYKYVVRVVGQGVTLLWGAQLKRTIVFARLPADWLGIGDLRVSCPAEAEWVCYVTCETTIGT
jgi:hypothetical protein